MTNTTFSRHHLLRLLAASPALLVALSAHAQEAKPAPAIKPAAEAPVQKVEVTGQANAYDARRYDTATKVVVTAEEIKKNGDTTLAEVLKRQPGITIGGVQGRGGDIRMRGLGSGYTQILVNGEPAPPGFSMDQVSPDAVERIEIMRAATAEFSTQAIAGAINIVLKRAIATGQRELKIGGVYDNGKPGVIANVQVSDRKGPMSYSVNGGFVYGKQRRPESTLIDTAYTATGAPVSRFTTLQNNEGTFYNLNLSPRVNFTLSPNDTVTSQTFVNVNNFKGTYNELVGTQLGAPPPYARTDANIDADFYMLRQDLTWTRKLGDGAKVDTKIGGNFNHRTFHVEGNAFSPAGPLALNREVGSESTDKGLTGNGKYSTPWREGHALAFGWDGGFSYRDEDRLQRENAPAGLRTDSFNEHYEATVRRLAVFGQDEWNITPRWSLYMGLRWEGIEVRTEGDTFKGATSKSSVWSPILQTLWKLPDTKNDQVRAAVTRTYKAPDVAALMPRGFSSVNNSPTTPDQTGNPNLKPELAWGLDGSYEHYFEAGGMISASGYVRRIEGYTRNLVSLVNNRWTVMPTNAGNAVTRGIELEAKLPLKQMNKELPAIDLRLNVARNWSKVDNIPGPNNRLDQQTPLSGNIGLDYKATTLPMTVGGNFNYQAGGPVRYAVNQYRYGAYKRSLDAYVLWKFDPKNQLRVSVSNALHQVNVGESTFIDTRGGIQDQVQITPTVAQVRALYEMKF
jgi:outer membrane receptor for ferrienterochelin and colicins